MGFALQSCLHRHLLREELTPEGLLFPPRVMRAGFLHSMNSDAVMVFVLLRVCRTLLDHGG